MRDWQRMIRALCVVIRLCNSWHQPVSGRGDAVSLSIYLVRCGRSVISLCRKVGMRTYVYEGEALAGGYGDVLGFESPAPHNALDADNRIINLKNYNYDTARKS